MNLVVLRHVQMVEPAAQVIDKLPLVQLAYHNLLVAFQYIQGILGQRHDIIEMIAADPGCGEEAVDVLMIAKYLERIGDHATNIAEWVLFSITGTHEL